MFLNLKFICTTGRSCAKNRIGTNKNVFLNKSGLSFSFKAPRPTYTRVKPNYIHLKGLNYFYLTLPSLKTSGFES